jgi:hypothetical protein
MYRANRNHRRPRELSGVERLTRRRSNSRGYCAAPATVARERATEAGTTQYQTL